MVGCGRTAGPAVAPAPGRPGAHCRPGHVLCCCAWPEPRVRSGGTAAVTQGAAGAAKAAPRKGPGPAGPGGRPGPPVAPAAPGWGPVMPGGSHPPAPSPCRGPRLRRGVWRRAPGGRALAVSAGARGPGGQVPGTRGAAPTAGDPAAPRVRPRWAWGAAPGGRASRPGAPWARGRRAGSPVSRRQRATWPCRESPLPPASRASPRVTPPRAFRPGAAAPLSAVRRPDRDRGRPAPSLPRAGCFPGWGRGGPLGGVPVDLQEGFPGEPGTFRGRPASRVRKPARGLRRKWPARPAPPARPGRSQGPVRDKGTGRARGPGRDACPAATIPP
ncbi:translation initiation factor IF-2 [Thermaerobacter marianensis DSM 12885]|uniref:Translation initiation factor IF-2 n=1 Tax=Thermaerobacter marianensis (strain ATCC 700841 / DSM 12885 / JCM 10246 / 7p75a) TaxID=644966 RepID=E6SJ89_THEM7|nr:translation initiation factor IF-2 [Thermaerobacter marianensis DSM 12885]